MIFFMRKLKNIAQNYQVYICQLGLYNLTIIFLYGQSVEMI